MERINNLPAIEWTDLQQYNDTRTAVLFTSQSAEKESQMYLRGINVAQKIYIQTADKKSVERLAEKPATAKVAYAVGGGRTIDIARLLAQKWGLEIICIPTIISSNAFLVDCTGLRENGCVTYVPSKRADKVFLDWKLLQKVPLRYHLSGCGDILSIYTGLYDWKYANKKSVARNDELYSPSVATIAKGILDSLFLEADEIKKGSKLGIETLITCLAMEVALCNFYGNSRPEEGGEHFFTYCIENKVPHFLHGEMVALGLLITAYLQSQDWKKIKSFLDYIGLDYKPNGVTRAVVLDTLQELPSYVTDHKLRYSIYNDFSFKLNEKKLKVFLKDVLNL